MGNGRSCRGRKGSRTVKLTTPPSSAELKNEWGPDFYCPFPPYAFMTYVETTFTEKCSKYKVLMKVTRT